MSDANRNKANLVSFEIMPQYTERGKQKAEIHRITLRGELLIADGLTTAQQVQDDLTAKINALVVGFSENGGNFQFFQDDGTVTNHCLLSSNSAALTDVQVVQRSWPEGDPAEYATQRTFHVVLQQELAARESQVTRYVETVRYTGWGGPHVEWIELPNGLAIYQVVKDLTLTEVIQEGEVFALDVWPLSRVPLPLYNSFPFERTKLRRLDLIYPRFTGRHHEDYGCRWRYVFHIPSYIQMVPDTPYF